MRVALKLWWALQRHTPRPGDRKRILACAYNEMVVDYLRDVCDLVRGDPRVTIHFTAPPEHQQALVDGRKLSARIELPFVGYLRARFSWWDLILFADHASAHAFHPEIPKLQVYHSLGSGKIINGENYRYGKSAIRSTGEPVFCRMLEASKTIRDRAVASRPVLEDVVVVVGDLRADRLLNLNKARSKMRSELGFSAQETIVLIQSTWGPASLLETVGHDLIDQAAKLQEEGRYQFILSAHPRYWQGGYAREHPWGELIREQAARGFRVIRPGEPFERFHVAADVAITDHTGLALSFALLGKPMIFVPIAPGTVLPTSWEAQLAKICPTLVHPTRLHETIQSALRSFPMAELNAMAEQIVSYRGRAAELARHEIYDALGMRGGLQDESDQGADSLRCFAAR